MVCEGGVGLFYFFGGDETDRAGLGGGCIPRRCTPASTGAPGRAAHHRQQGRPCQTRRTDTHARTPDTLHPIPDRPRRADRTGGGRWRVQCLYVACEMFLYACTFNLGLDNAYDRGRLSERKEHPRHCISSAGGVGLLAVTDSATDGESAFPFRQASRARRRGRRG